MEADRSPDFFLLPPNDPARPPLVDLTFELAQKSACLRRSVPAALAESLATLIAPEPSPLPPGHTITPDYLATLHRRVFTHTPEDQLWTDDPINGERIPIVPGEFRTRYARIGDLIAVSPFALPRHLAKFEAAYSNLGKADWILAIPAAHYSLLELRPFIDGNRRVAQALSDAMLNAVLDTGHIWSVTRALTRHELEYRSLNHLADFTRFFFTACIQEVDLMDHLLEPNRLRTRVVTWAAEQTLQGSIPARSAALLDAILHRGELPRGDAAQVIGHSERNTRRIVSVLLEKKVLISVIERGPLRLHFTPELAQEWLPGLLPQLPGRG